MLTWLKKYGLVILKDALIVLGIGSQAVQQLAPAGAAATTAVDTLTAIANIVTDVEAGAAAIGSVTGPQKLQAASALANQVVQDWFKNNLPGTPKVQNQQDWEAGITGIVNGVVAILNSAEPKVATTSGVAPAPQPAAPAGK